MIKEMDNYIGRKCIVRCQSAGVFFGEVAGVEDTAAGKEARMRNVRKVWYWHGAAAVEQLAQDGCDKESKLTVVVPEMVVAQAIQIIPCSDRAVEVMEALPVWSR